MYLHIPKTQSSVYPHDQCCLGPHQKDGFLQWAATNEQTQKWAGASQVSKGRLGDRKDGAERTYGLEDGEGVVSDVY